MSMVWKCDVCGKELTALTKGYWEYAGQKCFRHQIVVTLAEKTIHWDLCEGCTERLIEYMEALKRHLSHKRGDNE